MGWSGAPQAVHFRSTGPVGAAPGGGGAVPTTEGPDPAACDSSGFPHLKQKRPSSGFEAPQELQYTAMVSKGTGMLYLSLA